jgi:rhamnosyltransferase subunit B
LKAGIPQLITAMAHDQYDNGQRIKRAGVGDWLVARRFKAGRAARILQRLLESADVQSACESFAERMAGRDGLTEMAEKLEEFAVKRYG